MPISRKAKIKDIPQLVRLAVQLVQYHEDLDSYFAAAKNIKSVYKDYFRRCVYAKNYQVVVYEDAGKIHAYAIGKLEKRGPIFKIQKIASITEIFVAEAYRKKGVARELLGLLQAWFREHDRQYVEVTVNEKNIPGQKAWARCGFDAYNKRLLGRVDRL